MRLIDADALIERLKAWDTNDATDKALYNFALNRVLEAPTVEPERKRGDWIPQDYNKRNGYATTTVYYYPKCSVCGKNGDYTMRYCPNCGADMRGEHDG